MDNDDGLDIPDFLRRTEKQPRKARWYRVQRKRMTARERKFFEYAVRRAKRKRARFEWR